MPAASSAGRRSSRQTVWAWSCRSESSLRTAASVSAGRAPVDGEVDDAGAPLHDQAGDADHDHLVDVGAEDGQEPHPLEQRVGGVGGFLEHAALELQQAEFPVHEQVAGARIFHDGTPGRPPEGYRRRRGIM